MLLCLLNVLNSYSPKMSEIQIYNACRGTWHIGEDKRYKIIYIALVYDYKIVAIYKVRPQDWTKAEDKDEWSWSGDRDTEMEKVLVGRGVSGMFGEGQALRNPVRYADMEIDLVKL